MSNFGSGAAHRAWLVQQRQTRDQWLRTPTMGESMEIAYDETRYTELLDANRANEIKYWEADKAELKSLNENGQITDEDWKRFNRKTRRGTKTDWEGLGSFANETLGTEFDFSRESLQQKVQADSAERQALLENTNWTGDVAAFAGTAGAYLNPAESFANAAMLIVPGAQLKTGSSLLSTGFQMAWREAAFGLGEEVINQANVYDFKNRIGMEYSLSDAAMNLIVAGSLSGVAGGIIGMGRAGFNDFQVRAAQEATLQDYHSALDVTIKRAEKALGADFTGPIPIERLTNPAELAVIEDMRIALDVLENVPSGTSKKQAMNKVNEVLASRAYEEMEIDPAVRKEVEIAEQGASPSPDVEPQMQFKQVEPDDALVLNDETGDVVPLRKALDEEDVRFNEQEAKWTKFEECLSG